MLIDNIKFPKYTGIRCLMMPYIQGDIESIPLEFRQGYEDILSKVYLVKGDIGYLTIDESPTIKGKPHRGKRAKFDRAIHTEAGITNEGLYAWGHVPDYGWSGRRKVTLEPDTEILLANNMSNTCALWDAEHYNTTDDGDIGQYAEQYPIEDAIIMEAGEVHKIGILTPHESLPIEDSTKRQFLRIIGDGVHGREEYFTQNYLM